MTQQEKLSALEEIMDLDEGTLSPESELDSFVEWDSIASLSLIALLDEKFHKTVSGQEIRGCKTVADVLDIMEE